MSVTAITDTLVVAAWPTAEAITALRTLNVHLVISMTNRVPPPELSEPPFRLLHLPTNDSPLRPVPMGKLCTGVTAALPVIARGQGVAVHCSRGRHRSVAMACAILIGLGYSAEAAMFLVKARRAEADPSIWYIRRRITKFGKIWPQGCSAQKTRDDALREHLSTGGV
ncbi:MAG TPA: dual specificity protein phosphatase [Promineifilum sp.]|nr:dual specificity protein phosphatase [Promineifilum sp.]HQJ52632.1 dual specificity protein phosphatase [Anaerolineae bacterium]